MYIYKRYVEKLNKEYNGDDVNDYEEQWRWDYVIENKERKMRIEIGNQQTIKLISFYRILLYTSITSTPRYGSGWKGGQ